MATTEQKCISLKYGVPVNFSLRHFCISLYLLPIFVDTNFPSHLSIAFLWNNKKKIPVDWWQPMKWKICTLCFHDNTSNINASLVCFSGCLIALWSISSFGPLQGARAHLTCLTLQGTLTHTNTHSWSEMAHDRHAVLHHQTGKVKMWERKKLQTGKWKRISFSLHDIYWSYFTQQSNCSASLYVLNASIYCVSQWICYPGLKFFMYCLKISGAYNNNYSKKCSQFHFI